jgi:hypothetical protein
VKRRRNGQPGVCCTGHEILGLRFLRAVAANDREALEAVNLPKNGNQVMATLAAFCIESLGDDPVRELDKMIARLTGSQAKEGREGN